MILSWVRLRAHVVIGWFGHNNQQQQQAPPPQVIYQQAPPAKKSGIGMGGMLAAGKWP